MSLLPWSLRLLEMAAGMSAAAVELLLQSTLVIALGLTAAWLLRGRGPALRSAIYRAALVAILACPTATWLISALGLSAAIDWLPSLRPTVVKQMQPASDLASDELARAAVNENEGARAPDLFVGGQGSRANGLPANGIGDSSRGDARFSDAPLIASGTPSASNDRQGAESEGDRDLAASGVKSLRAEKPTWVVQPAAAALAVCVAVLWTIGSAIFALRLVLDHCRVLALCRGAPPADVGDQRLCQDLAAKLGIASPRLLRTPFLSGPCLTGFWRHTILLPEESSDVPLSSVLIHELAHLRRDDCRWNLLRHALKAVLFFQPLLWRLSRRMEEAAEEVCDDHVVHWGADRAVYADGLVRLAEQTTRSMSAVVPLVTFRSLLGQRVQRILDRSHRLSLKAGMRALCAIAVAGFVVTLLVGLLAPNGRSDAAPPPQGDAKKTVAAESKKAEDTTKPDALQDGSRRFSGTVLLPNGQPAIGAHVVLIGELRQGYRTIDFAADEPVLLARKLCDAAGKFELQAAGLSSQRYLHVHLLVRAAGRGLTWRAVNPDEPDSSFSIKLSDETQARGRLVTLEGRPATGVHVTVLGVGRNEARPSGISNGVYLDHMPAEVWPSGAITDADGWFTIRGISADTDLGLIIDQEPYAPERLSLDAMTTDPSKQVFMLSPAQIIKGVVVSADTGKPLANALIHAMQNWEPDLNHGMMSVEGKTDGYGRFRVNPYAAGAYTFTVLGPEGTPYLAKQIEFKWSETEREHEMRIELPRGVLVRGTIAEEPGGQPVAKATVRYTAWSKNTHAVGIPLDGMFRPAELSDELGRFTIAVPAGRGHLTVKSATGEHVLKELDARQIAEGRPGWGRLYVNADAAIDLADDAREQTMDFTIRRGATVTGEIVRSNGQPPKRIIMLHRGLMLPRSDEFWMYNPTVLAGNRIEIHGVSPDGELPVYLLDPDAKQGKRLSVRATDALKPLKVDLEPCGSLGMRFLGPNGKPVAGVDPRLMIVFTLGKSSFDLANTTGTPRADETYIQNFDRVNNGDLRADESGRITFPALIPGVTYRLLEFGDKDEDQTRWTYREITVKAGEHLNLPDIVIRNPDVLRYAEENWLKKQKEQAAKTAAAAMTAGNVGESSKQMPTGTFSAVEAPTVEKDVGAAMQQRAAAAAIGQMPTGTTSAVQAPTTERAMSNAAAQMHERSAATATSAKPSGAASDDAPLQIRGQVVAPDGKPVAGAKLFLMFWNPSSMPEREVKPKAVANAEGRFEFAVKRSDFGLAAGNDWIYSRVVATADGFGMAVGLIADFDVSGNVRLSQPAQVIEYFARRLSGKQPVLRLAPDDAPLTGRIVSLEGQPIAGARIALNEIWINEQANLDAWEKAAKEPQADFYSISRQTGLMENAPQLSHIVPAAATDRDGRFTLHGIGRERVVRLMISGAGIETKLIRARTRSGEKVVVPNEWRRQADGRVDEYYANNFTHVVAPSNAVVGKVTDRETGKPLAGVTIMSQRLHGNPIHGWGQDFIRTVSNADGEYRLEGMPLGDDSEIGAFTLDQPYLPINKRARIDVGSKPVQLDFQLPHGIWVEGRVTDKTTGKPLSGTVEYFVFWSNPNYKKLGRSDEIDVDLREYHRAGADGHFRIPALPGPGIIAVMADDNRTYSSRGTGAEKIAEGDTKMGALTFPTAPYVCTAVNFNMLTGINPPENPGVVKLDFALSSGATVTGKLIDADGKPIVGAIFCGDTPEFEIWRSTEQDSFRVYSYEPNRPRRLVFYEPKRNLAAIYMLNGDPPKTLVVRLEPAGSVRGRLVDELGSPLAGAMLIRALRPSREALTLSVSDLPLPIPPPNSERPNLEPATDNQGRFEIHGLIPGKDYLLRASREGHPGFVGQSPDSITVRAGETKDLGDITPKPVNSADDVEAMNTEEKVKSKSSTGNGAKSSPKESGKTNHDQPTKAAATSHNDSAPAGRKTDDVLISVHGRVLDPQGKPVAGADVAAIQGYWKIGHNSVQLIATKSDETGRFQIEFRKSQLVAGGGEPTRTVIIFASMPGAQYGVTWLYYDSIKPGEEIALRLVHDEPIDGRIVDLEGRPIAGVDVKVTSLDTNASSDLTTWLGAVRRGIPFFGSQSYDWPDRFLYTDFAGPWNTKTDADGRFRLTGLGHDRATDIKISGGGIAATELKVVTRPMEPFKVNTTSMSRLPQSAMYYGSHFQVAAEPSQPIEGVVRDAKTGQPLTGVRVVSNKFAGGEVSGLYWIETVSDQQGKYRIDGMPKGEGNQLVAIPADGHPYFMREFDVPTAPGLQPVKFDLALHRGALIQGRVSDKATGAPVEGALMYYIPWPDNPKIDEVADFARGSRHDEQGRYQTDRDGRYQLVGVPGRGLVEVTNVRIPRPIPPGQGLGEIADLPTQQQFMKVAGPLIPDARYTPAVKEIQIGQQDVQLQANFELDLGKQLLLRIVDPDGKPLTGVEVDAIWPRGQSFGTGNAGPTVIVDGMWSKEKRLVLLHQKERNLGKVLRVCWNDDGPGPVTVKLEPCATLKARLLDKNGDPVRGGTIRIEAETGSFALGLTDGATDRDGRLNYTSLLPGANYIVLCQNTQIGVQSVVKNLAVSPGETIDLGEFDVTSKNRPTPKRTTADMSMTPSASTVHASGGPKSSSKAAGKPSTGEPATSTPSEGVKAASKSGPSEGSNGPPKSTPTNSAPAVAATPSDPTPAGRNDADDLLSVHGRVLDPQGKPLAGAEVAAVQETWRFWRQSVPLVTTKSDDTGQFHLEFQKSQLGANLPQPLRSAAIAAYVPSGRYGVAWIECDSIKPVEIAALQIVADEPVEGQIVDLEGRPVVGVAVKVISLETNGKNDLTAWLGALKSGVPISGSQEHGWPDRRLSTEFAPQWTTKSDAAGRFRFSGLGRDRVADINVSGAGITAADLKVVTRPMEPFRIDTTRLRDFPESTTYYGSHFQFAAEPSQPIQGIVRDANTGQPLVGVRVTSLKFAGRDLFGDLSLKTLSDEHGHYRLEGMRNGEGNRILAMPADDQPYFMAEFKVPTAPGLEAVNCDLDLHRGVFIAGRVSDKVTGAPVEGAYMFFVPWPDNPNINGLAEFNNPSYRPPERYLTDRDGRYKLVGVPGRGLVEVAVPARAFPPGQGVSDIHDLPTASQFRKVGAGIVPDYQTPTAVKEVHIADRSVEARADIELEPGKRLTLNIVDPEGKPLTGVEAWGVWPRPYPRPQTNVGPTADVFGLRPDETRLVLLYQKERNLGDVLPVCWNDDGNGPKTVKLEPCATMKARLLDRQGDPVRGGQILVGSKSRSSALVSPYGATDSDGRLNYTTLVPGGTYDISCNGPQTGFQMVATNLTVSPGETIDLGEFDVTSKDRPTPKRTQP